LDKNYTDFLDKLSAESRILLLCSQVEIPESHIRLLNKLADDNPDWNRIHSLSLAHRLLPLVYKNLNLYLQDFVSQEIVARFKRDFQVLCGRNIHMTVALEKCIQALESHGIQALPFKGPVLAAMYGDITFRQFGDIDILVSRHDVIKAVQVLQAEGYYPFFRLSTGQMEKLCQTDNEYPLSHHKTGLSLDLQWELTGGYFKNELKLSDLQERLDEIMLVCTKVRSFVGENLLLYLCIHGTQHVWQSLDHVCCVNEVIRVNPKLEWGAVIAKAESLGAYTMLCTAILLAKKLLDSDVPEAIVSKMKNDRSVLRLVDEKCREITDSLSHQQETPLFSHRFDTFHLRSLDSKWAAVRYLCHLVFVPTRYDWEVYPLPAKLSFLHYILRPARMMLQSLSRLFGYLRK